MHPPRLPIPVNEADPLGAYQAGAVERRSGRPIPLAATRIRVLLEGGLAVVRTERVFRNAEAVSIEATLTFPVPVHATLFGLAARIDGRLLRGVAQRRDAARTSYEAAVDRGRSAVLHEELLRGVHMLSLAHVPPGAEVVVASDWAMPLAAAEGGVARLRIPVTVGDIYGCSPLAESDDLLTDSRRAARGGDRTGLRHRHGDAGRRPGAGFGPRPAAARPPDRHRGRRLGPGAVAGPRRRRAGRHAGDRAGAGRRGGAQRGGAGGPQRLDGQLWRPGQQA